MNSPETERDERTLTSDDGTSLALHTLSSQRSQSPHLLVAHATGFCARMYEPLAQEAGFTCSALDFRGHGDSDRPSDTTYPWERFGEDALTAARQLSQRFGPLIGFGHSMGGASLLMVAVEAPDLFVKLYVYEPIVLPPTLARPGESPLVAAARRRRDHFPSVAAALENFRRKPPLSELAPEVLELYVHAGFRSDPDGGIRLKCRREDEAQIFATSGIDAAWEKLADLQVPTLVAFGEKQRGFGPHSWAPEIAERLPRGRTEAFPGLGHLGPFESPTTVARSVSSWLGP